MGHPCMAVGSMTMSAMAMAVAVAVAVAPAHGALPVEDEEQVEPPQHELTT